MLDDGSSVALFLVAKDQLLLPRQPLSFDVAYISGDNIDSTEEGGPIQLQQGNYEITLQGNFEATSSFRLRFRVSTRGVSEDLRLLNTFTCVAGPVQCTSVLMLDSARRVDVISLTTSDNRVLMKRGTRLILKMI